MRVLSLGSAARQILAQKQEARLLGKTSQGIFLCTASSWVLFLSGEGYRGPLTLNVDGTPGSLREGLRDKISIQPDGLWFPKSGVWLSTEGAEEWNPPPIPRDPLSPARMLARLEEVSRKIRAQRDPVIDGALEGLLQALQNQQAERAASLISPLLGHGTGLTPAGDDLTAGLLLALNRWRHIVSSDFLVEAFNTLLIQDARSRTTKLSANLIECAARGQADERLVIGLDGLVTGIPDAAACAEAFNCWGNSSGGSVFLGIRLALTGLASRKHGAQAG